MSRNPGVMYRPAVTRTQQLRAARSAAMAKSINTETCRPAMICTTNQPPPRLAPGRPVTRSGTIPRAGPPPCDPKKVDFQRPGMTKAMMIRMQYNQNLQREQGRRHQTQNLLCPPTRSRTRTTVGPPISTVESRLSQDRPARRSAPPERPRSQPANPPSRTTSSRASLAPPRHRSQSPATSVSGRARDLAEAYDADVIQVEPQSNAAVTEQVILPPGSVNPNNTTIIDLPRIVLPAGNNEDQQNRIPSSTPLNNQCYDDQAGPSGCPSDVADRSVQAINESLDEQVITPATSVMTNALELANFLKNVVAFLISRLVDAAETTLMFAKLQELQNARREFLLGLLKFGNNFIKLPDEDMTALKAGLPQCSPKIYHIPDVETDPAFQPTYRRNHPQVVAAREYLARRRLEDEFSRIGEFCNEPDEYLDEEYLEGDALDCLEDDNGFSPRERYTAIPRRRPYQYPEYNQLDLERFCDTRTYPPRPPPEAPCSTYQGPPQGRENLYPDLWDLDDPWYHEAPCEPETDLIDFSRNHGC